MSFVMMRDARWRKEIKYAKAFEGKKYENLTHHEYYRMSLRCRQS